MEYFISYFHFFTQAIVVSGIVKVRFFYSQSRTFTNYAKILDGGYSSIKPFYRKCPFAMNMKCFSEFY